MSKILYTLVLSGIVSAAMPTAFAQGPDILNRPAPQYNIGEGVPAPSITGIGRHITLAAMPTWDAMLNLSDTQRSKVREVLTKAEQTSAPLLEAQKKTAKAFAEAVVNGAGEEKLTQLATEAAKADSDLFLDRVKTMAAVRQLLTEEQKKLFSNMMERATIPWRGFTIAPQPTGAVREPVTPAPAPAQNKPAASPVKKTPAAK